jgi:hypothetical protein
MKFGVKEFAELLMGLTIFTALSHYSAAFPEVRNGILWLFAIAVFGAIAWGGILVSLSLAQQASKENGEVSVALAVLCAVPAVVLLVIIFVGGLSGVITAWN